MPLEEYKNIVGTAAATVTVLQFFSPMVICKKIINQGNTKNVDSIPFVGGLGMGLLFLQQGFLLSDGPMISINVIASILNVLYIFIYFMYTSNKGELIGQIIKVLALVSIIIGYAQVDLRISPQRVELVYGTITTIFFFSLIGAPLLELKTIIKTKNAEKLPFPMILCGTFVTVLWLLYGVIIENVFVVFQNVVGFILTFTQLFLCLKYSGSGKEKDKAKKKE